MQMFWFPSTKIDRNFTIIFVLFALHIVRTYVCIFTSLALNFGRTSVSSTSAHILSIYYSTIEITCACILELAQTLKQFCLEVTEKTETRYTQQLGIPFLLILQVFHLVKVLVLPSAKIALDVTYGVLHLLPRILLSWYTYYSGGVFKRSQYSNPSTRGTIIIQVGKVNIIVQYSMT